MITVTHTLATLPQGTLCLPNTQLETICLKLAGGGYTEKLTIVAMMLADNLRNTGTAKFMGGKVVLTMTPDKEQ